jgi:hypothetical protein
MKIVPEQGAQVESGLCDVDRMAEIVKDLLVALPERLDAGQVPNEFMKDLECAIFAAQQMRDMIAALKVEFYADFEASKLKVRRVG